MSNKEILEFIQKIQNQINILDSFIRSAESAGVKLVSFRTYIDKINMILEEMREIVFDKLGD